jgi:phosphoesterase RecJ-like protein
MQHKIWELITDGLPVVITSHQRGDGDSVGASLALWHALKARGVQAYTLFEPPLPTVLEFLPGLDECLQDPAGLPGAYHLVVLDCGDLERVGGWAGELAGAAETINIDHHASNNRFGDVNLVEPEASSVGEQVHRLLAAAGEPLGLEVAECIFTAIVTDTGQFGFENTTAEALDACARCVRAGVRPNVLADRLFMSPTRAQFALRQMAEATVELHEGGRLATMVVTRGMFRRTGLGPVDTDRFANIPLHIHGVAAAVVLKELPDEDCIKVSMRSRAPVDVCAVACSFGGGGHARAAGCQIGGGLDEVRRLVLERLRDQLHADTRGAGT